VRILFCHEQRQPDFPEEKLYQGEESASRVYSIFAISAFFIIGAGIWLATIGDEIAMFTGWGESFVGSFFLAFSTTLPELTVSFAAMSIGATDLAVASMIGSNLFNMTIVPVDDLLYLKGPVLAAVSEGHLITALSVIIMTLLFIIGLRFKPRRFFRLSWWNCLMIALFFVSTYYSFTLA